MVRYKIKDGNAKRKIVMDAYRETDAPDQLITDLELASDDMIQLIFQAWEEFPEERGSERDIRNLT